MGTVIEPVPVTGLVANFSPMPWMAPPFGKYDRGGLVEAGGAGRVIAAFPLCWF
jgi:hypothetical protein